ncbi:MAG TPA: hypothetical protein VGR26_07445 [Acidimicrobiales bacterium]|nr:hypothetical protein [Acidimicrobiales bacterium]
MDEHEIFHDHSTRRVPLTASEDLLVSTTRCCACRGSGDDDMCDRACIEGRPILAREHRIETT